MSLRSKLVPIYQKVAMPHIRRFACNTLLNYNKISRDCIGKKIPERLKRFRDKAGEVSRNRRQGESGFYIRLRGPVDAGRRVSIHQNGTRFPIAYSAAFHHAIDWCV